VNQEKLSLDKDRELLRFIFARFIDGEFTGLKEGVAMQYAPDLEAADFLARQIRDEIRHAKMYKTLYLLCDKTGRIPKSPWILNAIMNPISGRLWMEHCFLDKAIGERWVLHLMQALVDNVDDRRVVNTLKAIARDERSHIAFGEHETRKAMKASAFKRRYLWGLYLRVDFAMMLAFFFLKSLIARRYSTGAASILEHFFTQTREIILVEAANLLEVKPKRSVAQMLFFQLVFLLRWPFVGWTRHPRNTF